MAWVMSFLGAVLALGGGYALWNGSGYIRLDWGQAETVAGTVALSAGIVAVGLAAVLFALRDLARAPARAAASGVGLEAVRLDGSGEAAARGRPGATLATAGPPGAERIEPAVAAPLPEVTGADRDLDEPFTDSRPLAAPAAAMPGPGPSRPAVQPPAEAPTVVGRYEANGASYVLFSDGTIEVETENGTHRFDSMAHLRDHIERQDAG